MIQPPKSLVEALLDDLGADVPVPAPARPAAPVDRGDRPAASARPALAAAVADLSSPSADRRRAALARLRGERDLLDMDTVRPLLADPDPGIRLLAVGTVADRADSEAAHFDDVCRDPDAAVRAAALSAVLRLGGESATRAVAQLAADAQERHALDLLVETAADVFRSTGDDPRRLRPLLAAGASWLPGASARARRTLAEAVGVAALRRAAEGAATPPAARPIALALVQAMEDRAPDATGDERGPEDERGALPGEGADPVAVVVGRALARAAGRDPDPSVRRRALASLDSVARTTREGGDTDGTDEPDEPDEPGDTATVARAESDASARALARQLVDPDHLVRRAAVDALAALPEGAGLPGVVAALRDDVLDVREAARRHLAARGDVITARLLVAALGSTLGDDLAVELLAGMPDAARVALAEAGDSPSRRREAAIERAALAVARAGGLRNS